MIKNADKKLFVFYMFLVLTITLLAALIIIHVNDNVVKLTKENKEIKRELSHKEERISDLEKLNKSYEWQVEQVPYVIEMWCNGE